MHVAVVGSGYVGLVTAACLAESGNHVIGVDNNQSKLEQLRRGESPIYEPGLSEMLQANLHAGRLTFTDDLAGAVGQSQVVFIAVGTPPREDGTADLSAVEAVAAAIGKAIKQPTTVVTKSTVPVGTGDRVEALVRANTKEKCWIVSNPEFLKEGTAIDDFLRPDRVVVGANEPEPAEVLTELHSPFVRNNNPVLVVSRRAAEMAKYSANAYLSTRISFINEIATLCEHVDVDVNEVRRAMCSDARIGHHFMYPGLGYGGSCFPKDVQALAATANQVGFDSFLLKAVHERNQAQRQRMIERILGRLGPSLEGKHFAIWGLAFKPNTDDIREAPAIDIVNAICKNGGSVSVYDAKAIEKSREVWEQSLGDKVTYADNAYAALDGADALIICTEWSEFQSPDFEDIKARLKQPLIFDGRNLYTMPRMKKHGFEYHSIGRPSVVQ